MIINRKKGKNLQMTMEIVETATFVTLLGGGAVDAADLDLALTVAPVLVAADGGADMALALGRMPRAVIGDLDSLSPAGRAALDPSSVHHIPEQDSTDFDKALRSIAAPLILAVGFTGRRIDHELAAYHVLVMRAERRCVILGAEDIVFHAPPTLRLDLPVGTRLSLFPLAEVAVASTGLRWPTDGLAFHPARLIGTSNAVAGDAVTLRPSGPGMLVILPRAHLAAVIPALVAADIWPRTTAPVSVRN